MNNLMDKLSFGKSSAARVRMLNIALIVTLLWSMVGIAPTAMAGPVGPKYTWELFDDRKFVDVAFGNGVYVAITERRETVNFDQVDISTLWVSDDMLDWEEINLTALTTRPLAKVHYDNGRFVLTAKRSSGQTSGPNPQPLYSGAVMLHSTNGEVWTGLPHSVSDSLYNTTYTSGLYFANRYWVGAANGAQGRIFNPTTSEWSSMQMIPANSYYNDLIVYDGKLFVGAHNWDTQDKMGLGVTEDAGATWTKYDSTVLASIRAFASNGGTLVGVGGGGDGVIFRDGRPGAVVINHGLTGISVTKGTLSEPYEPQTGEFISASYSVMSNQFLALSQKGDVYYSDDEGVTWHPDYSTMGAGTGLISTILGDFAFTSAGVFKRAELGDHAVASSLTGNDSSATTFTVTVSDSDAVPVSEAGIVYSTSNVRLPGAPQQAGITGTVSGSNHQFDVVLSGLDGGTEYYYWPYSKDAMGYMYYGDGGSFVTPEPAEAPQFLTQPEDATAWVGESGPALSVTASVYDGGTLSYQWYGNSLNSNMGGVPIDGAVQPTFIAPTDQAGIFYYYAGVTNTVAGLADTTAYSHTAKITVYPNLPKGIEDIDDQTLTELVTGYAAGTQEAREIDITNIGTTDLNHLAVTLSGLHAGSFNVTQPPAVLAKGAPAASFTVSAADGLPAGTYEAVVTITADGMAPASFNVLQRVNNAGAPAIPRNLTAIGDSGKVNLSWDTVTGATYYNVYMSTTSLQYDLPPVTPVYDTAYSVDGLANGTTYYFVVQAAAAESSGFSNQASATPASVPDAPMNVTASAGDRSVRLAFAVPNDGGSPITGYRVISSTDESFEAGSSLPIVIQGLQNGQEYSFEVRAINAIGPGPWSAVSNEVTPRASSSSSSNPQTPGGDNQSGENDAVVLVNGKEERIGKASTVEVNGRTVTTVTVDEDQLRERLKQAGQSPMITLPVEQDSDVIIGELTGVMVEELERGGAVVEIRTPRGSYALPASQVDILATAARFGGNAELKDVKLRIQIATSGQAAAQTMRDKAGKDGFEVIAEPMHYTVTAEYNGVSVEIGTFNRYVERSIAIPSGADPNKITTGVVLDADGTLRHVPTHVIEEGGRYSAVINSLTNSDYAVVWNPLAFSDVESHWSKAAVNDMGSRLIVKGITGGLFGPDRQVTRAEFAAIVASGLGLKPQAAASSFSDVTANDWFAASVNAAAAYGLVIGYADGTFRPQDPITREQAMVIIAKAMTVTGLKSKLPATAADDMLRKYSDSREVSAWGVSGVVDSVKSGIVQGRSKELLAPQANITRAEAAVLIRQLLQKSGLI